MQFPEIVVSVARKTDAALWPALFAAVGSPLRLCQGLMRADHLQARNAGFAAWLLLGIVFCSDSASARG